MKTVTVVGARPLFIKGEILFRVSKNEKGKSSTSDCKCF